MTFVRLSAATLAAILVLGLASAATSRTAEAQPAGCAGNLLKNAGFEGGSHKTESIGTSLSSAVGDGWVPWFVRGNERDNREPEFKVEQVAIGGDPHRIHSGGQGQKFFTTWGTHTAGFYQRVNVRPGATLTFGIYGMAYTGEADGWNGETFVSDMDHPGNYEMLVGIDPTGAVPSMGAHPPATVIWSPGTMTYDQWVWLTVSAAAKSGAITVYTKGAPYWAVKHNDSFWDDACLMYGGTAAAAPVTAGTGAGTAKVASTGTAKVATTGATTAATAPTGNSYVVVRGDTLSKLARLYGVTVAALAQANNIANPSLISVGQRLAIPGR